MKSLKLNGRDIGYEDFGQGRPLLLVHGFPLDHTMWSEQHPLASERVRVIAPDLPGFGRSSLRGDVVTMEQFADDLAGLLDALGVAEPIVLCGLSMGGYIAFQFWRKYAARLGAMILCDTRAATDSPDAATGRRVMAERVQREGPAPLIDSMLPRVLGATTQRERPQLVESLRGVMMSNPPRGIAAAARGMAERPDMTAALAEIRCPTLVVVGAEDAASPPAEVRAMAQSIPGARYIEVPAAGHLSPLENPAAFNAAVTEFLEEVAKRH
ncbi:MAG: alpha/beta fold hydrolase [Thermoguttaceae bacterium]